MFTTTEVLYIISGVIEASVFIYGAYKAFMKPKKLSHVLITFDLLTLPASIINILSYMDQVPMHWNSFAYLSSTLFMMALHFWLNLDVGKNLRAGGIQWKHPLVLVGAVGLAGSLICIITQMISLLIRGDTYPIRPVFITGVCLAIFCDGATYIYSFSSLIHFKGQRFHEGQSITTALGVWFLTIQCIWYSVFGVLYIWFFFQEWDSFTVLLVFDYLLRFILCLMFTWPPPQSIIRLMSARLSSGSSHEDEYTTRYNTAQVVQNTLEIAMADTGTNCHISYGHRQTAHFEKYTHDGHIRDTESIKTNSYFSSNVAIIDKLQ